ncbi:MAG: cell division protein SepF [Bacillota bacterium]
MSEKIFDWNKILKFFGLEGENDNPPENSEITDKKNKVVSINKKKKYKVLFYNPDSFEMAKTITDNLKNNNIVIVNLENKNKDLSQRILDFLSGVIYALNGHTQKVGKEVFIFTPNNIKIDGKELKKDLKSKYFSNNS